MKRTNDSIAREYVARVVLDYFGHVSIKGVRGYNLEEYTTLESLKELRDKKNDYINYIIEAMNEK